MSQTSTVNKSGRHNYLCNINSENKFNLYYIFTFCFQFPPVLGRASSPSDEPLRQRKGSILRAASALAKKTDKEDINYVPLKSWTKQPTTHELITEKVVRRNRYGFEVDFPDFQMPFNKNVAIRCDALGGFDDDD